MKVLVCGSRYWTDKNLIRNRLKEIYPQGALEVVTGGASGADKIAKEIALDLGVIVHQYLPDWDKYGKSAGPIRNQKMITEERPDLVLAFVKRFAANKGTHDLIIRAWTSGIPVIIIDNEWDD